MLLTFLIVFVYFGGILTLYFCRILDQKDLLSNLTIAFGWIVALLIAFIHINRAKEDNKKLKREEIRRKLEIEAFHEINNALKEFSNKTTSLATFFLMLPGKLEAHLKNPMIFKFDIQVISQEIMKLDIDVLTGETNFLSTFEANEIIVLEFNHYKKFFIMRTEDLNEKVRKFIDYFVNEYFNLLKDNSKYKIFKEKCDEIWKFSSGTSAYLHDLRVLLINSKLGEIFDVFVPMRVPLDPKYKLLTEIAIKEEVEKQAEEREKTAIGNSEQCQE